MSAAHLAIVGGTVVNDDWHGKATVLIHGGHVTRLASPDDAVPRGTEIVDAAGRLVMPGGVDPHTHIDMALGDYRTRDGYREATTAAVWGGTTTVVDFAIPVPGQSPLEAVRERRAAAAEGICDAALHACVVDWNDSIPDQLREIAELGVRTVKLFTTYRDVVMADPGTVVEVMRTLRELGGLAYVHARPTTSWRATSSGPRARAASTRPGTRPRVPSTPRSPPSTRSWRPRARSAHRSTSSTRRRLPPSMRSVGPASRA